MQSKIEQHELSKSKLKLQEVEIEYNKKLIRLFMQIKDCELTEIEKVKLKSYTTQRLLEILNSCSNQIEKLINGNPMEKDHFVNFLDKRNKNWFI